jgi:quercetin dioxygenase-like cupin family protein
MATPQTKISQQPRAGHEFIEGTLDKPLLQFDLSREVAELHKDESWNQPAGRSSKTLVKHPDMRIVLIAMKAHTRMHEHTAAARISAHTLSGHVRFHLPEHVAELPAGHLLALDECVPHDVEAAEDSAFLLTLSWLPQRKLAQSQPARRKTVRRKRK